jgi:hypothetical protein
MEKKRSRIRREALCPPIGALLRYQARIVRVVAEARGQRAMIESLDATGRTFRPRRLDSMTPVRRRLACREESDAG